LNDGNNSNKNNNNISHYPRTNSPQIQDPHPIPQVRLLDVALQHGNLGLLKRLVAPGVQTRAVLHAGAEGADHDARPDLVVLLVGRGRLDGDGLAPQALDEGHLAGLRLAQRRGLDLGQALRQLSTDAPADQDVGQVAAV
jgi:hypothetical protein